MKKNQHKTFVVCVKNEQWPESLELRKIYESLPDIVAEKDGFIRVIDESGEDYLFPKSCFLKIKLEPKVEKALVAA